LQAFAAAHAQRKMPLLIISDYSIRSTSDRLALTKALQEVTWLRSDFRGDLIVKFILLTIITTVAVIFVVAQQPAAKLPNFAYWSAKELKGYEQPLRDKVSGEHKTSSISLADYGSSNVAISHREARGIPEIHDHMDDYFVVQSGEATLVIGGEVVNARAIEPHETRGDAITGGETRKLTAGDIVHIPARLPHQLLVGKGKRFTYFVIKVKA
jgi:mannose-6-phosphate isomerase-like protein (cupin superfamily)